MNLSSGYDTSHQSYNRGRNVFRTDDDKCILGITEFLSMTQVKDTSHPGPWFILFMFGIGVALLMITYCMYNDSLWQDEMSVRSPIVCMKILYGTRGWRTVKTLMWFMPVIKESHTV